VFWCFDPRAENPFDPTQVFILICCLGVFGCFVWRRGQRVRPPPCPPAPAWTVRRTPSWVAGEPVSFHAPMRPCLKRCNPTMRRSENSQWPKISCQKKAPPPLKDFSRLRIDSRLSSARSAPLVCAVPSRRCCSTQSLHVPVRILRMLCTGMRWILMIVCAVV
jgi:hypothetical protein